MKSKKIDELYQRCIEVYARYQRISLRDAAYVIDKYDGRAYIEQEQASMQRMDDKQLYADIDWFIEDNRSV